MNRLPPTSQTVKLDADEYPLTLHHTNQLHVRLRKTTLAYLEEEAAEVPERSRPVVAEAAVNALAILLVAASEDREVAPQDLGSLSFKLRRAIERLLAEHANQTASG